MESFGSHIENLWMPGERSLECAKGRAKSPFVENPFHRQPYLFVPPPELQLMPFHVHVRRWSFPLWMLCVAMLFPVASTDGGERPNIIFILCDDLGWGDIGILHQNNRATNKKFVTPHLDSMARNGAQLLQHYCPAPVCAPSRASLLLGQHQGNAAIRDSQFDKALPNQPTLASVLKSAGYQTAIIGKYGLAGDARYSMQKNGTNPSEWPAYPTKRGFDEFLGYVRHVDGHIHYPADNWSLGNSESHRTPKEVWHNEVEISKDLANCYTTDLFTAYAKHWISKHRAESQDPFFLYLAYDTPHAALQVPSCPYPEGMGTAGGVQWTGKPGAMINTAIGELDSFRHPDTTGKGWSDVEERFVTMVRRIDQGVGDLLQTLKDLGEFENTLVVLSSDNGPHHESYLASAEYQPTSFQSYGPFDGTKRDTWEGGIRVPTIAIWPDRLPKGTVDSSPSQFHDWMATFAEVAGLPSPAICDGVSLLPSMTASGKRQSSTIYVEYLHRGSTQKYDDFQDRKRGRKRGQMQVVQMDGFKGVRTNILSHADPFQIYDLDADPKELRDLALNPDGSQNDAMLSLQERMHDHVLRIRQSNPTAPRPYDDQLIPAVDLESAGFKGVVPGAVVIHQELNCDFVPALVLDHEEPERIQVYDQHDEPSDAQVTSVVIQGHLKVDADGEYDFELSSALPSVLRMHGFTLINNESDHQSGQPRRGHAKLQQGMHPIRLHVKVRGGERPEFSLRWATGNSQLHRIPTSSVVIPLRLDDSK
ncbi:MAG: sulfatase-like hydrolase/transferase [Planctomycetota bacterium]